MRLGLTFSVLLVLLAPTSAGAEKFLKGPYLQRVTSRSVVVMWQSQSGQDGRIVVQSPMEPDVVVPVSSGRMQEVLVEGLKAARRYTYRVEVGDAVETGEFATAPEGDAPFSFIVFGDSRSNAGAHTMLVERVRREVPDFILGTGDFVNSGGLEIDWETSFDIERDLLRNNVLYPSLGNHDREGSSRRADRYRKYFSVPDDSPDPERYYAFTYGNSRFLVLDSNSHSFALTDQTAWLERELRAAVSDPKIKHIFVSMHHPPYSVALHGGQPQLREMWTPLFEKYGVDAVFSGHDHCYNRAYKNGVHYIVSGGGGAPLYPRDPKASRIDEEATVYYERTYNFVRVQVTGEFVEMAAVRGDGTLIETLAWGEMPKVAEKKRRPVRVAPEPEPPQVATAGPSLQAPEGGSGCEVAPGACPSGGCGAPWLAMAAGGLLLLWWTRRR